MPTCEARLQNKKERKDRDGNGLQNVRGEPKVLKDLESMDDLERGVRNFYNHEPNFTVVSQTKCCPGKHQLGTRERPWYCLRAVLAVRFASNKAKNILFSVPRLGPLLYCSAGPGYLGVRGASQCQSEICDNICANQAATLGNELETAAAS